MPLDYRCNSRMSRRTGLDGLLDHAAGNHPTSGILDNDNTFLTWPEVQAKTAALAARLIRAGVGPKDRVAVHHPRSAASFIAVHATLRAGAVMVPLDPFGPADGIATVVQAVEPAALMCTPATLARHDLVALLESPLVIVCNGSTDVLADAGFPPERVIDFAEACSGPHSQQVAVPLEPHDPAYIIFTSGSTGVPKGIVHTHASGLAYAHMAGAAHEIEPRDRLAAIAPLHFDMATLDLFAIPLAGASVVMTSEAEQRFPASLSKRLETGQASIIYTTPYQLQQLAGRGELNKRDLSQVRQVAFGGEAFAPQTLVALGQLFPASELLNVYGPAEVNGVTVHSFGRAPAELASVPIGRACVGVEIVLVDDTDQVVADGESGEILVQSPTMMTGYWKRPDLNADCFVEIDGATHYRTGDRAHRDADGRLQFEGRRDNLIKVRGVRIELEAIERVLEDAPGVAHAVAGRVDLDGVQQIMAWLVSASDTIDNAAVTAWCRDRLPANAVPTVLQTIKTLPMTATGKIDRASLRNSVGSSEDNATTRR